MTTFLRHWAVLALVVVGGLVSFARADDAERLRWNFQAGQRSDYVGTQELNIELTARGRPTQIHHKQTIDMTWLVESVDDEGNAQVVQTINRMRVKGDGGPAGDVDLDSAARDKSGDGKVAADETEKVGKRGDDETANDEPLFLLVRQPLRLTIDPRGEIVDVELPDALERRLKEAGSEEEAFLLSKDNLKQFTSMNTLVFPAGPIARGDTWKKESDVPDPMTGKQHVTTTYRYEGSEEIAGTRLEKIAASAKAAPPKLPRGTPQLTVKEQSSKGTIYFDRSAGRIERLKMDTKTTVEIDAPGGPVRQSTTVKVEMRRADDKPADAKPAPPRRKNAPKRASGKEKLDL
jgi:hypothetical protein